MTEDFAGAPWLSLITFAPLLGALCIIARRALARKEDDGQIEAGEQVLVDQTARWIALGFTIITFVISVFVYFAFDPTLVGYQFVLEKGVDHPALADNARTQRIAAA
ncbi:MAG: hypothetical protein AAFW83_01750, partial [Pseudomonadota bacterium]